jgi:hypothetical protein
LRSRRSSRRGRGDIFLQFAQQLRGDAGICGEPGLFLESFNGSTGTGPHQTVDLALIIAQGLQPPLDFALYLIMQLSDPVFTDPAVDR